MKTLFFDIETVPTPQALVENGLEDVQRQLGEKETIKRLSLSAVTAQIVCIGFAVEPPRDAPIGVIHGEEVEMLREFWRLAADVRLFVGHNILDFDLRFIYQRSVINRVKPSREIPFARFRSAPVFDTMHEWTRWGRDLVKLDVLARSLGIPSPKTDLDGSKVYERFRGGGHNDIYEYCKGDVDTVRAVYRRLTFSD